jgi:hypothetical protein
MAVLPAMLARHAATVVDGESGLTAIAIAAIDHRRRPRRPLLHYTGLVWSTTELVDAKVMLRTGVLFAGLAATAALS